MQVFYCDNQINIEMTVTSVHQKVPEKESRVISKRIGFTDDIATFNRLAKLILFVNRVWNNSVPETELCRTSGYHNPTNSNIRNIFLMHFMPLNMVKVPSTIIFNLISRVTKNLTHKKVQQR